MIFRHFNLLTAAVMAAMLFSLCGCSGETPKSGDKLRTCCGLPPVAFLVEKIGGSRVQNTTFLPEGRTPHDFHPRTFTLLEAAKSAVFFSVGQSFEQKIAAFLKNKAAVCDVTAGINGIHFTDGSGKHRHCDDPHCASHDDREPHFWLSAKNAKIMAENITAALSAADPDGAGEYRKNCDQLLKELHQLDAEITASMHPFAGKTFFVYHPAFGYFARDYALKQRAVELNGREAGANQVAAIIREAKALNATTVFVQKQFNPRTAEALAQQIGGKVEFLDPLEYDLAANLRRIAAALKAGFSGK